jgi:hypothetical protein
MSLGNVKLRETLPQKRSPRITSSPFVPHRVLPFARVYELIDGTQVVKFHGTGDMPIWGDVYKLSSAESGMALNPEVYVRARILALSEYLYRLKAK